MLPGVFSLPLKIVLMFCMKIILDTGSNQLLRQSCLSEIDRLSVAFQTSLLALRNTGIISSLQELEIKLGISCSVASYFSKKHEVSMDKRCNVLFEVATISENI